MSKVLKGWLVGVLTAVGLTAGGLPAEASEVVKLARLVVSGKRTTPEPARVATPEAKPSGQASQIHINGGNDDAGTAPAPSRGVS